MTRNFINTKILFHKNLFNKVRKYCISSMAKSKYEYVKDFEMDDKVVDNCWLVVRLDSKNFRKFSDSHNFEKPNDLRGINLMNHAASSVMKEFNEIVMAYGQSDGFSFVFHRSAKVYNRRESKLLSYVNSTFLSSYIFYWNRWFEKEKLQYPPRFDARINLYPTTENLKDYFYWRQADLHNNNLYNTCLWNLVLNEGITKDTPKLTEQEAIDRLKDTSAAQKNEILFQEFGINYNTLPPIYRKGTILMNKQIKVDGEKKKTVPVPIYEDFIKGKFWKNNEGLLENKSPKLFEFPDQKIPILVEKIIENY